MAAKSTQQLPGGFLTPPRFRLVVETNGDGFTDFFVVFRRQQRKLGITIHEVEGEIAILKLLPSESMTNGPGSPVAVDAGIQVGDILRGVNDKMLLRGIGVREVLRLLDIEDIYIKLLFQRRNEHYKSSDKMELKKPGNVAGIEAARPSQSTVDAVVMSSRAFTPRKSNAAGRLLDSMPRSHRGPPMLLADNFLAPPRFRLIIDSVTDVATNFTIIFRRQRNKKLGITVHEVDGEVCIHSLQRETYTSTPGSATRYSTRSLALDAGVRPGDVIVGVNTEFFSHGAEVQDVLEMLNSADSYLTVHFSRRHPSSSNSFANHKCAVIFVEQKVIPKEKVEYTTRALHRLRDRVLQWDTGFISQKLESWKLTQSTDSPSGSVLTNFWSSGDIFLEPRSNLVNAVATNSAGVNRAQSVSTGSPGAVTEKKFHSSHSVASLTAAVNSSNVDSQAPNSSVNKKTGEIVFPTVNLRPALSVRLVRAEEKKDHISYVIWVMDIRSGAEWIVYRRFREFYEFRDHLSNIRPSIAKLDFPPKRFNVTETKTMITERLELLQKFLRRISSLVCVNSLHPSTARVQLALQQFLLVNDRLDSIQLLEAQTTTASPHEPPSPRHIPRLNTNMVQVYVHSVMQMAIMDRVLMGFTENFLSDSENDSNVKWTEEKGRQVLMTLRDFMDNLQQVMEDGIGDDCVDISRKLRAMAEKRAPKPKRVPIGSRPLSTRKIASAKLKILDSTSGSKKNKVKFQDSSGAVASDLSSKVTFEQSHAEELQQNENADEELDVVVLPEEARSEHLRQLTLERCTEDSLRQMASSVIRRQVEIEIYVACAGRVRFVLEKSFAASEAILEKKLQKLSLQPQSFYGVQLCHISPSGWEDVIYQLRGIRIPTLPHDRLQCLMDLSKSIPALFALEHPNTRLPLGADDFLPIFIYILVQARLPHLLALNEELQALCSPDKRMSETGYYLATLEASVMHLLEADVESGAATFAAQFRASSVYTRGEESDDEESERRKSQDSNGSSERFTLEERHAIVDPVYLDSDESGDNDISETKEMEMRNGATAIEIEMKKVCLHPSRAYESGKTSSEESSFEQIWKEMVEEEDSEVEVESIFREVDGNAVTDDQTKACGSDERHDDDNSDNALLQSSTGTDEKFDYTRPSMRPFNSEIGRCEAIFDDEWKEFEDLRDLDGEGVAIND